MTTFRNPHEHLIRFAGLLALLLAAWAGLAAAAEKTPFWLALRSNLVLDKQVADELGPRAGIVIFRAPPDGPAGYAFPDIVARMKASAPNAPVLSYALLSRHQRQGRIEAYLLRDINIGEPIAEKERKGRDEMDFVDVTNPEYRKAVIERLKAERSKLKVDGYAIDLAIRTPSSGPKIMADVCGRKPGYCDLYAKSMDDLIGTLNAAIGEPGTVIFNGLWNHRAGEIEDQARMLALADGAAIEFFGMDPAAEQRGEAAPKREVQEKRQPRNINPNGPNAAKRAERERQREAKMAARAGGGHTFTHDVLPYVDAMSRLPADKPVYVYGRGTLKYISYADDYRWQRYLYGAFLLGRRKQDMFKYHSSFQVPAHAGRSGGLDAYADWNIDLGDARGPYRAQSGLYTRDFANGRVIVAPDDGGGGFVQASGYTPDGQQLSGTATLRAGEALILLSSPPKQPAQTKEIAAKTIGSWNLQQASLSGDRIQFKPMQSGLEGEHDVLLDYERSRAPFTRLSIEGLSLASDGSVLAVAEVDDSQGRAVWAVAAVGAQAARSGPVQFRTPALEREREGWPVVPVQSAARNATLVLDGPQVFSSSGLTFRRWSHVRFVGGAELSRIVLANRAQIQ